MATEKIIFEFDVKGGDAALKEAAALNVRIRQNKESIKELSQAYEENAVEITKLQQENKELATSQRALSKSASAVEGSYDSLSAEMAQLKRQQKQINITTKEGQKEYERYGKRINDINSRLKKLDATNGVHTRNVGNYQLALKDAAGQLNIMGVNVGQVTTQFTQASRAVQATTGAIGGANKMLKLLRFAIIATGIGALVIALASVVSYFSRTREGGETIRVLFKQIGQVVNVLIERLTIAGKAIFDFFRGDWKGAVEGLTDAFKGMGDELEREVVLIGELERRAIKLEKAQILLNAQRANTKRAIKDLQLIAEQENKTLDERINAIQKAIDLQKGLNALEIQTQKQKIQNILGEVEGREKLNFVLQQLDEGFTTLDEAAAKANVLIDQIGLDPSTVDDLKELVDEYIRFNDVQSDALKLERTLTTKLNELQNKREATAKKSGVAGVIKRRTVAISEELAITEELTEATIEREAVTVEAYNNMNRAAIDYEVTLLKLGRVGAQSFEGIALAVGEMVGSGATSIENFKKILLLGLLDTLQGMIPVLSAQITGISLAQPDAVATFGASAVARVAALNALLIGAVQGAKAYVTSQFAQGGLTEGGMFEGASHAQGGVKFKVGGRIHEAEGGEAIINKRSTLMFKPILSAINQAGGGKKFETGGLTSFIPSMSGIMNKQLESEQLKAIEMAMMQQKTVLQIPVTTAMQNGINTVEVNSTL